MRRAKKIGLVILAGVAVLLAAIATRPATFEVARSATIAAPAEVIYAQINDLHRWGAWNPFEKGDPGIKLTYLGAQSGVGAAYHYVSEQTGEGRMTVTDVTPNRRVAVRAEFIKPFAATNEIEFTLDPTPNGVTITWAMRGNNNFVGKAIGLFVNMDRMVGAQFEKGLADLKQVAEREAKARQGGGA